MSSVFRIIFSALLLPEVWGRKSPGGEIISPPGLKRAVLYRFQDGINRVSLYWKDVSDFQILA